MIALECSGEKKVFECARSHVLKGLGNRQFGLELLSFQHNAKRIIQFGVAYTPKGFEGSSYTSFEGFIEILP